MDLKQRFYQLVNSYTKNQDLINSLWSAIAIRYAENHRTYHNLNHITEIFKAFDTYKSKLENPDIVAFSIFYHDIIYSIYKKNNEEKSALFALQELTPLNFSLNTSLYNNHTFLDGIKNQIIATKTHTAINNDTKWLLDFDLEILGKSSEVYKNYTKKIREEYKLIPTILYKQGRKKVLQHFIDKPFIYNTDTFINLYEKQAKLNLSNELKSL